MPASASLVCSFDLDPLRAPQRPPHDRRQLPVRPLDHPVAAISRLAVPLVPGAHALLAAVVVAVALLVELVLGPHDLARERVAEVIDRAARDEVGAGLALARGGSGRDGGVLREEGARVGPGGHAVEVPPKASPIIRIPIVWTSGTVRSLHTESPPLPIVCTFTLYVIVNPMIASVPKIPPAWAPKEKFRFD